MRVLVLGPLDSPLIDVLRSVGEDVRASADSIDVMLLEDLRPDFLVSFGYRHIIRKDVLARVPSRAINLHISYLPFNRGADPNLWSVLEGTPKGVTIHYLDEGIDTGDVIAQRIVGFSKDDTLRSSHAKLQEAVIQLFRQEWPSIRRGSCPRERQVGVGTFHRSQDIEQVRNLLDRGWDTPIAGLAERYRVLQS